MIIQFTHPGKEINLNQRSRKNGTSYIFHTPDSGLRCWNNEKAHFRKFLKHKGWYLENIGQSFDPNPKKGELFFWGEWEPQSRFRLSGNPYSSQPSLPHAVHEALFNPSEKGVHNTDPFVFGDHFYYTNCKQKRTGKGKNMLALQPQSIILFGSERSRTDFVLDTMFVVDGSEDVFAYRTHRDRYPAVLRKSTIDLRLGLSGWHKLYRGKMYDYNKRYTAKKPYAFCFVPCKVACDKIGFERPIIDWKKYGLQKPGAYTVLSMVDRSSETEYWNDIVKEILSQGFSLGIQLEMPETTENTCCLSRR